MTNPFTKFSGKKLFGLHLGVILFVSILVILPIWMDGIPSSMDIPQQFQFAQIFYDAVKNGEFYPSWAAQPNYGYGDVGVRFYPPLTYYILDFFRLISGSWFDAALLFFVFGFFLSGVGVYLWSREWFAENASLAAACVFIILPYHIQQIYIGALFAEFTAAAILPFCFLFVTRICQKGSLSDVLGLAVSFGLLILTHLPTTIMASLALGVYALFSLKKSDFLRSIFKLSVAVAVGFLLSSFYWVRIIGELGFVKHNSETFSTGYYSFKTEFVFSYLFPFADIFHSSPMTLMSLVTILTLGILIPSCVFYWLKAREDKQFEIKSVVAMTILALVMATPLSLKIWEYVPLLQKIQYPFRWLTLFSLGSAIIVAAGFKGVNENLKTPKRYLSILVIGLFLICLPFNYFKLMNPFITYPKDYFLTIVERFKISPSCECWWTTWAQKVDGDQAKMALARPKFIADKVVLNERKFEVKSWQSTERVFTIETGEAGQASIATSYYPHWKTEVNGQIVEVSPSEIGLISFPVPSEKAEVRVYFAEPNFVKTAYLLSGLGWLILLFISLFYWFLRKKKVDNV